MIKVMMLNMFITHEEGLWIAMQALCPCRPTPFILTFGVQLVDLNSRELYRVIMVTYWANLPSLPNLSHQLISSPCHNLTRGDLNIFILMTILVQDVFDGGDFHEEHFPQVDN